MIEYIMDRLKKINEYNYRYESNFITDVAILIEYFALNKKRDSEYKILDDELLNYKMNNSEFEKLTTAISDYIKKNIKQNDNALRGMMWALSKSYNNNFFTIFREALLYYVDVNEEIACQIIYFIGNCDKGYEKKLIETYNLIKDKVSKEEAKEFIADYSEILNIRLIKNSQERNHI